MTRRTQSPARVVVSLAAEECYRLLRQDVVGRVIFTRHALPTAIPVRYVVDGKDVVLRVEANTGLGDVLESGLVAFQVDTVDLTSHTGWSVVIVGRAVASEEAGATLVRIRPEEMMGHSLQETDPSD
jgi:nitroimidazol reductase NimA-like FMN-containing flavoprotein (pyridoxamine 5'-phosphate oxidase superfamily)